MAEQNGAMDATGYTYRMGPDESVSEAVARAVAAASGRDQRGPSAAVPSDIGMAPPLYGRVDPDALNALFEPTVDFPRHRGELSFPFAGYQVTVEATGVITVSDT